MSLLSLLFFCVSMLIVPFLYRLLLPVCMVEGFYSIFLNWYNSTCTWPGTTRFRVSHEDDKMKKSVVLCVDEEASDTSSTITLQEDHNESLEYQAKENGMTEKMATTTKRTYRLGAIPVPHNNSQHSDGCQQLPPPPTVKDKGYTCNKFYALRQIHCLPVYINWLFRLINVIQNKNKVYLKITSLGTYL